MKKKLVSSHDVVCVLENGEGQRALHANRDFEAEEVITLFDAKEILSHPTYLTIQTGSHTHITLMPEWLQFVNHSCEPNVFFDTDTMNFLALIGISKGDELRFFYPSTEWKMAQAFDCNCRSKKCLKKISGAAEMDENVLGGYRLTDFILKNLGVSKNQGG